MPLMRNTSFKSTTSIRPINRKVEEAVGSQGGETYSRFVLTCWTHHLGL